MIKTTIIDKADFQENEIFIPVYEKKIEENILFQKIVQNDKEALLSRAKKFGFIGEKDQFFSYKNYHFFGLGKEDLVSKNSYFETVKSVFKKAVKEKHLDIYFIVDENYLSQTVDAFYFARYVFGKYLTEEKDKKNLNLNLILSTAYGKDLEKKLLYSECVSSGTDLSRDLINEPSSSVHPNTLLDNASRIVADSEGYLELEVLDRGKCLKLGMNAYLAVAQGSHREPFFIILKTKNKASKSDKPIVLIGKSLTFDSGGLSLKPSESMEDMKTDMAGGAIVLGVFETMSKLKKNNLEIEKNIIGILPACENMPSSEAIRPGDIVKALNGKTIEVLNTDAEGRLTLSDALSYAEKYLNPEVIIDLATLTGSIMSALGPDIAGLFSNNPKLATLIVDSGDQVGEIIWEMPLHDSYSKHIKSNIADLRNISKIRLGGSITASLFLKNFITDKIRWAHLDLGGAVYEKLATGWGVRTVINLLNKTI